MIVLLFGPPGAGKGTQSAFLIERKGMKHVSTGNLFRYHMKEDTPLGKEAKGYMEKGELVPDSVTVGMVENELLNLKDQSIIFDGFPRTVPQAEALGGLLSKVGRSIDHVVFVEVDQQLLIERLAGRRMTADGKYVYHIKFNPPKTEGVCDVTGEELIQRKDDQENVIATRLSAYEESTSPLKEYYQRAGLLKTIDGRGEPEEVYSRIESILES